MKILLTGARGFIGGHLAEALLSDHHRLVCPVRAAPHDASDDARAIFVPVDFASCVRPEDWSPLLDGVDVVINTVGIFRQERGQSFQRIHETVPLALFKAARQRRALVIQFSALGADRNAQSAFHTSKRAADDGLRALADTTDRIEYYDVNSFLCPDGTCSSARGDGRNLYYDPGHFSLAGSWSVGEGIVRRDGVPAVFANLASLTSAPR